MMSSDENNPTLMKPTNSQGVRKFGQELRHNRRALSVINQNLVASQALPCVVNKMCLSENSQFCKKNVGNAAPRPPLTRKSAAEVDSKQTHPNERKKLKPTVPSRNEFGDSIFVDDIDCRENLAPMNLERSESGERLNEADETDEVEMEDIDGEESVLDIDGCDSKNPLAVVDYVEDLYVHYRTMEIHSCVSPDYMGQQFDINEKMRAILIDWLIEVHYKFELLDETLFLTVNLIDRFLAKQTVIRKKLQLVGLVAMLLACKYEEVSVPIVEDLIIISDRAYTRQDFLEMEKLMLNTLLFNMSLPTPYVFIKRFLKAARSDKKLELLSFFLIDLSLVEYEMLKFPPSLMAAAAVYTAYCTLYGFREWNKTCEWHSSYSEEELLECSKLMVGFHQRAATGKLTGVHRKYSTSKFNYTAKQEPALFLLDNQL